MSNTKKTKPVSADKDKKPKLVRDSFTIPKNEYSAIDDLKARALAAGVAIKKSELLRAGLMALSGMNDAAFKGALAAVPTLKTGRPTQTPEAKPVVSAPVRAPRATRAPAKKAATAPAAKKAPVKPAVQPAARKAAAKRAPAKTTKPA